LGFFFFMYGFVRLATSMISLPERAREYHLKRAGEKNRSAMLEGLAAYFEGRYAKAEKAAVQAMEAMESPALNAVVAARSAHELRAYERRDGHLARAEDLEPSQKMLRLMTGAELLLEERRYAEALKILKDMKASGGRQHTAALRLELKAEQHLKNWDAVLDLAAQLDTRNAFDAAYSEQLKRHARIEKLKHKVVDGKDRFLAYWQKIPESERRDAKTASVAAQTFISFKECGLAQKVIEESLDGQWNSHLVAIYADCPEPDTVKRIERAELWLKKHDDDAILLLTLGRLCMHQKLWGKARNYLDASLSVHPSAAAHLAQARLAEIMQKPTEAEQHYRFAQEMILGA
ncbi:MAG TPA: heme biosynthesis HemY N-terminal domain-containing protein, partial [Burkholderiales bacterium]|nr:heme biosynthesis HemY N-terminal domain-containing protein [Burkholderiales bacterium]